MKLIIVFYYAITLGNINLISLFNHAKKCDLLVLELNYRVFFNHTKKDKYGLEINLYILFDTT